MTDKKYFVLVKEKTTPPPNEIIYQGSDRGVALKVAEPHSVTQLYDLSAREETCFISRQMLNFGQPKSQLGAIIAVPRNVLEALLLRF